MEHENLELKKLDIQYRYAWDWFSYHAGQRLMGFRFFLIIIGAVSIGYSQFLAEKDFIIRMIICLFGAFISLAFFFLEIRNEELVNCGRHALDELEEKIDLQIRENDRERKYLKESLGWPLRLCPCVGKLTRHRFWLRRIYIVMFILFFWLAIRTLVLN